MKIALVHEFLTQLGGAERVLLNFLEIWPDATVHVLIYDEKRTEGLFQDFQKKISFIDSLPLAHRHHRLLISLMPWAIESFDFSNFDLVISDSSSFAKGVKTDKLHICYCHTPTRYLWTNEDYLDNQTYPAILKWVGRPVLKWLKSWDRKAASRPNFFIANSENIKNQIQKFYGRDSIVIRPPVDTDFFKPTATKADYFFTASRLEPYKKIEIVIEAFNKLGWPLKVAGTGTNLGKLKAMSKSNIEFLGRISDEELRNRYSEAKAFIFPAEEDAGIMVLEAAACGTPVIAFGKGGSLEIVKAGLTGEFFYVQTADSLEKVLEKFDPSHYKSEIMRQHARQFDKKNFQKEIKQFTESKYLESRK